jgi:DNA-binding HxlR family transcriptional regulator/DNA-binding response OmpR family regulator
VTRDGDVTTVTETVDLISKKWHPAIIQTLLTSGPLRFSELQTSLDGVSGKVLTDSLGDLVEKGLVKRVVVSESPQRVEYELTPHGRDLQGVLEALASWGDQHLGNNSLPTVLVVDDDPRLANMHASWLEDTYHVKRAHSGAEALRELTDDVDVVLLDRRMPGMSGEEVLARINDLSIDCGVIMLTAIEPDFDVVELGIDDYIVKPGRKSDLTETVADVLERSALDDRVREYLALTAKRALLRAETTAVERERSEEYAALVARLDQLRTTLEGPTDDIDTDTLHDMLTNDR